MAFPLSGPIHTINRVNDYVADKFSRFLGSGADLYSGETAFTLIDTGYDGNPLSVVPYKPDQSTRVWAYIANGLRMSKANTDGTRYSMGIVPPNIIPDVELIKPLYFAPAITFTNHLDAAAVTVETRVDPATASIQAITFISGTTGWAVIALTGATSKNVAAGMRLRLGGSEFVTVEEVHKLNVGTNFVKAVVYDDQTSNIGLCTIQPNNIITGLARNSMVRFAGGEYVRVISVTQGSDGNSSFRCKTVHTIVASNSIDAPAFNIWAYCVGTHAAGEGCYAFYQRSSISVFGPSDVPGTGVIAVNLPGFGFSSINGRAWGNDDFIHFGVKIDIPSNVIEGKFVIDIDPSTTGTYADTDGNTNAYYKSFRPNDLQPVINQAQTSSLSATVAIQNTQQKVTLQQAASRILGYNLPIVSSLSGITAFPVGVPAPGGVNVYGDNFFGDPVLQFFLPIPGVDYFANELVLGSNTFNEFTMKLADLVKIGSGLTADLSVITAIQFRFLCRGNTSCTIYVNDIWIGGTYSPDNSGGLTPFQYRYRYRSSTTGAKSLPGPAIRTGISSARQGIQLTGVSSTDPQVDKLDWERLGGSNLEWNYVGTCDNDNPSFFDNQASAAILVNPSLENDTVQPFPLAISPKTMQVNIAGTEALRLSGDVIEADLAVGTSVIVNGITTSLYASPQGNVLSFVENVGGGIDIKLEIPDPVRAGQPLPVMWGPFHNTIFSCGNDLDAGTLYFTKEFDPDSSPFTASVEVTSPSEIMMNGCLYDGRCYVFSDKRMFSILPTGNKIPWSTTEIPNGKGLFSKWAFCVGPKIWFLSHDGIYETTGSAPTLISEDIKLMFPQGDQVGLTTNGIVPVDMLTPGNLLRLEYHDGYLFFDYIDTNGAPSSLAYNTITKSWYQDVFFRDDGIPTVGNRGFVCRYSETGKVTPGGSSEIEEVKDLLGGTNDGYLYRFAGYSDDGIPISGKIRVPAVNHGDTRSKKQFGDTILDIDPQGVNITVLPYIDNYSVAQTPSIFNNPIRYITNPIEFGDDGLLARNLGIDITWSTGTVRPKFYYWEPSLLVRPEDTFLRPTDQDDANKSGAKFVQGFILDADTGGVDKDVMLQGDLTDLQLYTFNHNGRTQVPYDLDPPKIASLLRLVPQSSTNVFWRFFGIRWIYEPVPELVTLYQTQTTTHDIPGWQFLKDGYIAHMSTSDLTLTIKIDNKDYVYTIPHSNGLYVKDYLIFTLDTALQQNLKGKLFSYGISSAEGFRLFKKDCEFRVHAWAGGGYQIVRPFGGDSFIKGADI